MRCFKVLLIFSIVLTIAANCVKIDEIKQAELKTKAALDKLYQAVERRDLKGISELYLDKPFTMMVSPFREEVLYGPKEIQQEWAAKLRQVEKVKIFRGKETIRVSQDLKTCWVTATHRVDIKTLQGERSVNVMISAVLEKHGPAWFFVLTHFSFSDLKVKAAKPSKPEASAAPANKAEEEAIQPKAAPLDATIQDTTKIERKEPATSDTTNSKARKSNSNYSF